MSLPLSPSDAAAGEPPLRMRDLTSAMGLSRQAIHFYIGEGLLPPPVKKGRNAASYSREHLERLRLIQRLQRENFLSLEAIKAVLNGDALDDFSPQQCQLLTRIRDQLPDWAKPERQRKVPVTQAVQGRIPDEEIDEMAAAGLINVSGRGPKRLVSEDDAALLDCVVQYKDAGATPERGYGPSNLAVLDQAVGSIARQLSEFYAQAWADAPGDDAVAFMKAAVVIDERLMGILLRKRLREHIGKLSAQDAPVNE